MNLPFTVEQFFAVFGDYNEAIWPGQIVAYALGLAVVVSLVKRTKWSGRFAFAVLALFWLWMGAVYHFAFFSEINSAAKLFAALFIIQGVILAAIGTCLNRVEFGKVASVHAIVGGVFIVFSMLIYPLIGYLAGHRYPAVPMFGVAPCPTTIFTFGVLLFTRSRVPWYVFVVPLLWSVVGMNAAISLRVPQDYGLLVAGIVGTIMIMMKNRALKKRPNQSLPGPESDVL